MESAAVIAVAHQAGIPFVAIRAIADRADVMVPQSVLTSLDPFGRLRAAQVPRKTICSSKRSLFADWPGAKFSDGASLTGGRCRFGRKRSACPVGIPDWYF